MGDPVFQACEVYEGGGGARGEALVLSGLGLGLGSTEKEKDKEEDKEGEGHGESNRWCGAEEELQQTGYSLYAMRIASTSCKGAYIRVVNMHAYCVLHTMHTNRYDYSRRRSESAVSAAACLPACLPLWRYTS